MFIQIECPNCGKLLKAPDGAAGKTGKCPQCGTSIPLPAAGSVPDPANAVGPTAAAQADVLEPELVDDGASGQDPAGYDLEGAGLDAGAPDDSGLDRRPCPMCGEMIPVTAVKCRFCGEVFDAEIKRLGVAADAEISPDWARVRSGVSTVYNCMVIAIIAALVLGVTAVAAADSSGGTAILLILGLVVVGAAIGIIVGQVICATVPSDSGARGLAIGAAICVIANVLISVVAELPGNGAPRLLGSLVSIVGSILFILFIRRSASYLHDQTLASSCAKFLVYLGVLAAGLFLLGFAAAASGEKGFVALLGIVVLVCGLIALVWYLRLLRGLRTTIDTRLGRS